LPADLPFLLGEVRTLTDRYKAGTADSFQAFRALLALAVASRAAATEPSRWLSPAARVLRGLP
jgi:hypothetical protein